MRLNPSKLLEVANKTVKPNFRVGTWRVWEKYDVLEIGDGDVYVLAQDNANDEVYAPLAQVPALFLEFARLAEEGEITREVWIDWIERYGVLGLQWRNPNDPNEWPPWLPVGPVCEEGGSAESHRNFASEARHANWLLRLWESLDSAEGPDYTEFMEEAYAIRGKSYQPVRKEAREKSIDGAKSWALRILWQEVEREVKECYPALHPVEGSFVQGWSFHSLISAMYLQMMWLLTATGDEVRRCKRPECSRVVDYEQPEQPDTIGLKKNDRSKGYKTRTDKDFCGDRCRGRYHYHYRKKRRGCNGP